MKRNYGIDLCRCVVMLMVVIHHVLAHGGVMNVLTEGTVKYNAAYLINILVLCAVDCFALISGYVGYGTKTKYSNIVMLWLRVAFYSISIAIVFSLFAPNYLGEGWLVRSVFPVMSTQYWYFTAYVPVFFIAPLINNAVRNTSELTLKITMLVFCILFCICPFTFHGDMFSLRGGFTPIWLMACYFIGAVIKKEETRIVTSPTIMIIVYLAVAIIEWLLGLNGIISLEISMNYSFILTLLRAIVLLLLFKDLRIPQILQKVIHCISPLVFSVYLIHDNLLIKSYFIKGLFNRVEQESLPVMVLTIIGGACVIFFICIMIDSIRELIFNKLQIKKVLVRLEKKYMERVST